MYKRQVHKARFTTRSREKREMAWVDHAVLQLLLLFLPLPLVRVLVLFLPLLLPRMLRTLLPCADQVLPLLVDAAIKDWICAKVFVLHFEVGRTANGCSTGSGKPGYEIGCMRQFDTSMS